MSSVSQAPPPRRAPRFWLRIVLLFAFILAAPFGWFLVGRIRVEWRLRSAWAEADRLDPGWRYDELEAKRGPLPDAENGALPVLEAMRHFPKGVYEPQWNAIALPPDISNEARAEWRWRLEQDLIELPANVSLNGQQETALLGELAQWQAALEPARRVRHYSTARFNYTLKDGWRMRADIGDSRSVGKLLRSDVLLQVHRRQWAAAVDSTRAALALGRIHADEPVHFPQLLRHVDYANAGNLIDRLLGQGEPPPPLLSELRNDLRIDSAQPFLRWIVRAFRDDIENTVARLNEGPLTDAAVKEHMELLEPRSRDKIQTKPSGNSWLERWRERAERDWKLRHAELVESANQWTIVVELPIGEQYEAFKRRKQGDVIFLESLIHSSVERALHTHAMLRALDAGLAVECYRQKHGRWPEGLDELTPEFCDAVPIDVYTGKPLQYRRHKDGVVVYSVGPDETDNGGKFHLEPDEPYVPYPERLDFGIMLWDVAKRCAAARPPLPLPKPQMDEDLP